MNNLTKNCKDCREHLSDLLLDPASVSAPIEAHINTCDACREELASLRATFDALDSWTAPEPSAYFDTRLYARVREAQAAPPEGFFERVRAFFMFSTGRHLRPALAGALALAFAVSGASYVGVNGLPHLGPNQASATVNDLKIMDNNAVALQQMDQLLDDSSDDSDPPTT